MNTENKVNIAGSYFFKSPYHKNKKKLPFLIESDGYVTTVEYRGFEASLVQAWYKMEDLIKMIEDKFIVPGNASFPKKLHRQE
jgi:hypothetical protein